MDKELHERMIMLAHNTSETPEQITDRAQAYVGFVQQGAGADAKVPAGQEKR